MSEMPRHLRFIHHDDAATRTAARSPTNALAELPEPPRVYFDSGSLFLTQVVQAGWTEAQWVAAAANLSFVWVDNLLSGQGGGSPVSAEIIQATNSLIAELAALLRSYGVDPRNIRLVCDWEGWNAATERELTGIVNPVTVYEDFKAFRNSVRAWPGPVGNYSNSEGEFVPGQFRWPWLRNINGISVPVSYHDCPIASVMKDTIAAARTIVGSTRPRQTVALLIDPWAFRHRDEEGGVTTMQSYLHVTDDADFVLWWATSPLHQTTSDPELADKGDAWRYEQDRLTGKALTRGRSRALTRRTP